MERITQLVNSIAGALFADNEYQMLKAVSELGTQRSEISVVLNLLKTVFRDALMKTDLLSGQADIVEKFRLASPRRSLWRFAMRCSRLLKWLIKMQTQPCWQQEFLMN
jgi:hypothetical protein